VRALCRVVSFFPIELDACRTPVIVFLSDGECGVGDQTVRNLCRSAVALGYRSFLLRAGCKINLPIISKPLSLQTISFGTENMALRRMAAIALEVQRAAPQDPLIPAAATVDSSYAEALDSVCTFHL
jgi:hypothetical protein